MHPGRASLLGKSAVARVPMVIAFGDDRPPQKIEAFTQQVDFFPSLAYLIGQHKKPGQDQPEPA